MENVHHLLYLFRARENDQHASLKAKLAAAMVYTKVGKKLSGFLKSVGDSLQSQSKACCCHGLHKSWQEVEWIPQECWGLIAVSKQSLLLPWSTQKLARS